MLHWEGSSAMRNLTTMQKKKATRNFHQCKGVADWLRSFYATCWLACFFLCATCWLAVSRNKQHRQFEMDCGNVLKDKHTRTDTCRLMTSTAKTKEYRSKTNLRSWRSLETSVWAPYWILAEERESDKAEIVSCKRGTESYPESSLSPMILQELLVGTRAAMLD